jgi:hypothetical protein
LEIGRAPDRMPASRSRARGARGLLLPAATKLGNPTEDTLLPATAQELKRLGVIARDVALDAGFNPGPTASALPDAERVFIAGDSRPAPDTATAGSRSTASAAKAAPRQTTLRRAPRASQGPRPAPRPRSAGASSLTTSTRSPSGPPDSIHNRFGTPNPEPICNHGRPTGRPCSSSAPIVYPGK